MLLQFQKNSPQDGFDEFLVICSDGVWEFVSSQESVTMCDRFLGTNVNEKGKNRETAEKFVDSAEMLARESWDRWNKHMLGQVVDDITAIVVRL